MQSAFFTPVWWLARGFWFLLFNQQQYSIKKTKSKNCHSVHWAICSPLLYPLFLFPFYRFIYHLYQNFGIVSILQSFIYLILNLINPFPIPFFPSSNTFQYALFLECFEIFGNHSAGNISALCQQFSGYSWVFFYKLENLVWRLLWTLLWTFLWTLLWTIGIVPLESYPDTPLHWLHNRHG